MKVRLLLAVAVLASAAVHLKVWVDGYRDLTSSSARRSC